MKILIADDDPASAGQLPDHLRSLLPFRLEQIACAETCDATLACLRGSTFDALLLDPVLQNGRGVELLARAVRRPPTIVISARTELAVRAFEGGAIDFVPKPVRAPRLAEALRRVPCEMVARPGAPTFLAVRRHGRIDLVPVEDLLYAEGADKYSELVQSNGRRDLHDKTLSGLEAALPADFVRIHKSFLVRLALVAGLHVLRGSRYFAELKDGRRLPVGRTRYARLKSLLI